MLVLATGMRMGELLALTWEDINLGRGTVTVRMTLQRHRGGGLLAEEAKTDHSKRVIALPGVALEALSQHRVRQNAEREQLGDAWNDLNLVFPNTIGRPMEPNSLRYRWWCRLVKRAGLPQIRFHDLRHTAATLLLARGVPVKVVSEMLGHANISITLNLYGHVLPHMQQQAAETMDAVLRASVSQGSKLGSSDRE